MPARTLLTCAVVLLSACEAVISDHPPAPPSEVTPPPPDSKPQPREVRGYFDIIDGAGVAAGWAYAPSSEAAPIDVALYADGDAQTGTLVATVTANHPRGDVNTHEKITGDHGFEAALPASLKDGAPHLIHVFGVGPSGPVELDHSPLPFTVAPCSSAGPKVPPGEGEYVVTLKAENGKFVTAECGGDDLGVVNAHRDAAAEWETFYVLPQPSGAVSIRSSHGRNLSAEGGGGDEVHANRTGVGPWEQFGLSGNLTDGAVITLRSSDQLHFVSAHPEQAAVAVDARATMAGPHERFTLQVVSSPVKLRKGVVRADGRSFVDDDGAFYPLGGTLFWALSGWKAEPDRLKQNLTFLTRHHYDYVRILGEVDWAGHAIDPSWPDYAQVLGEFIDYAYDVCGLRTELTLVGGVGDPMVIAQKVAAVINAGRQHKILDLEIANESYGRPLTLTAMRNAGRYLRQNVPNLVALSSGEGLSSYVPNSMDWRADYVSTYMPSDAANLGTIHMDRGYGDGGWRAMRQPWDWKDFPFPVSHNEPIGPRSSVAEETDPVRLAMLRVVGLINGVEAFVLHNGAGVMGVVDPAHNRPANLWEVPGIDAVMDAVRGVDVWMPPRAGDGQHWNNAWAGNPLVADAFWSDGSDHGVNRNYTVSTADGWISTEAGVKDHVVLTPSRHSLIEVFDVLKGKVQEIELQAGQPLTLTPDSRDSNGYGAFVVVGHFR